jgi:hypothetical protein
VQSRQDRAGQGRALCGNAMDGTRVAQLQQEHAKAPQLGTAAAWNYPQREIRVSLTLQQAW